MSGPERPRVLLVGSLPFPVGGAPTSRTRSIALGLHESGADVRVFGLADSAGSKRLAGERQDWRGIEYRTWPARTTSRNRHLERLSSLSALVGVKPYRAGERQILRAARSEIESRRVDFVVAYNQHPGFALHLLRDCRHHGVKFVQQLVEWHESSDYFFRAAEPNFLRESLHIQLLPRFFDGALVISRFLRDAIAKRRGPRSLIVPALINTEQSTDPEPWPPIQARGPVVTYVGAGASRDLVDLLVDGVRRFRERGGRILVRLVGLAPRALAACAQRISTERLQDSVEAMGWVTTERLSELRAESHAYVWLRRDGRSGRAAFPTRLPELLISGKPTMVSDVGDISLYLRHGENALFVRGEDPGDVAIRFAELVSMTDAGRSIGLAGREAALYQFGYRRYGHMISDYLSSLVS